VGDPAWPVVCSSTPSVSVIIVNYNAGTLLLECVDSCIDEDTEVIVVDNHSTDNSIDLLRTKLTKTSKPVTIIVNKSNVGFAAACNIGASEAKADSLLFLNPDCRMDPGALKALTSTLAHNPQSGMVGALLVDPDGKEQGGGRRAVPTPWRSFVRAFG
jgi:GT2 family glycosyltransferase